MTLVIAHLQGSFKLLLIFILPVDKIPFLEWVKLLLKPQKKNILKSPKF